MVKQVDRRAVFFGKVAHGLPDEGQIVPVLRDQLVVQFIRRAHGVVRQAILAEIARHAQKPRLFMRFAFKRGRGL